MAETEETSSIARENTCGWKIRRPIAPDTKSKAIKFFIPWRRPLAIAMAGMIAAAIGCGGSDPSSTSLIHVTTPTPTPTARGLWVANRGANGGIENVVEFKGAVLSSPGVSIPTPAIINSSASLNGPLGLTFDSTENQWVGDRNANNIVEFKLATLKNLAITPNPPADVTILDDGTGAFLEAPQTITFERGNLWVANYGNTNSSGRVSSGFVTEYLASQLGTSGSPTPNVTEVDPEFVGPDGIAFDSAGNLFVADFDASKVWVFKASTVAGWSGIGVNATSDAQLSDGTSVQPTAAALDPNGNLWVADCEGENPGAGELYMFPKSALTTGATAAAAIFNPTAVTTSNGVDYSLNCPGSIAFDSKGNLWYSNFISSAGASGSVGEFLKSQLAVTGASSPVPNIYLEGDTAATVFNDPENIAFGPAL